MKQASILLYLLISLTYSGISQIYPAYPANWMFPEGNPEGTKRQSFRSDTQTVANFQIKWFNNSISGDVQPLIGNIINNPVINPAKMIFAPNEIAAVVAGKIIVIDAFGKTHTINTTPKSYLKNISVLFDTLTSSLGSFVTNPVVMGLETIEFKNDKDSVAYTYLAGYDQSADTVALIKRMAIDLRKDFKNYHTSIKPVWGKQFNGNFIVYAEVNMSRPNETTDSNGGYFRGLAEFKSDIQLYNYPLPDLGDNSAMRLYLGPETHFAQPSLSLLGNIKTSMLFPFYPSTQLNNSISNTITPSISTNPGKNYLAGYQFIGDIIVSDIGPYDLTSMFPATSSKPIIRPYYIHVSGRKSADSVLILVAEQYKGSDSSNGVSKLHLFNSRGTVELTSTPNAPPFLGGQNHLWSVAVGDVDGVNPSNQWLPYYPQNPGQEIIVTQTSRDFAVAGSKLFILKYDTNRTLKPTPPNSYLFQFDTVASQRINGWVAAVNDLDGDMTNYKDEIALVDGSTLRIVRLRDYTDKRFQSGMPFDTVFEYNFKNETISNVAIADLDGDGKNDLAVTTYFGTYLIGTLMPYTLHIVPDPLPPMPICAGDTVRFKWANLVRNYGEVDIKFHVYNNNIPSKDTILISSSFKNDKDTVSFSWRALKDVLGKSGRFIVQSKKNPTLIYDSTGIFTFETAQVSLDPFAQSAYRSGESFLVSGSTLCVDSLKLYFSLDDSVWTYMGGTKTDSTGRYMISAEMPCPSIFGCSTKDITNQIKLKLIYDSYIYRDTTSSFALTILPALFPLNFDTSTTICPTINFYWNINAVKMPCDSLSVLVSANSGNTFVEIAKVKGTDNKFSWKIPLTLPDSIMVRFCCESSCERIDTMLYNFKPKYINIVSPNPFNPLREELEICYQVPENTQVSVKVLDESDRVVAEPVKNESRIQGIAYCDRWNGTMWDGSVAANGMYYLVMEFSNQTREVYPVFIRR